MNNKTGESPGGTLKNAEQVLVSGAGTWGAAGVWGGKVGCLDAAENMGTGNDFQLLPLLPCTDLTHDLRGHMPVAWGKYQDSREHGIDGGKWFWILCFSYLRSAS